MSKKHNIKVDECHTGIVVSYTDRNSGDTCPDQLYFESISDARQFAYELLEATMDFVINNNNNKQQ